MLARQNHPSWKVLKARMVIALAIDALVVLPILLHNSEMWFGRRVPLGPQLAFAALIAIATFVYALRTHLRITDEAQESIMAAINERDAGLKKALAEFEEKMAKAQATLSSLVEQAFAEAQMHLSVLEEAEGDGTGKRGGFGKRRRNSSRWFRACISSSGCNRLHLILRSGRQSNRSRMERTPTSKSPP